MNQNNEEITLAKVKANKKLVLTALSEKAEDLSRKEAAVFLLNNLGVPCKLENITNQDIREAFNGLSTKNKQIFIKGMTLHTEKIQLAEKDFQEGKLKTIAKLPYHLINTVIKGGATGFSIGLAINQVFPSLLPVNFGAAISQLPELLAQTSLVFPEYINTLLQLISTLGASAIPQNVYHGAILIGATVVGATAYTITKGTAKIIQKLCASARKKHKENSVKRYAKKHRNELSEIENS